ncbi:adenosine deaminase [Martelella mediterranea]|uniref:Adenine deaminase n=1 Tax=Martelella mediterranea DSM 17316 TaxID=1122214 RepID=A0A1U9YVH8_9HYPH|nr:adenosine deaminase [Martelella mediterranea]AQZ49400.1 Adenine deaminase [Martelella mediterranea DSM 17316]
MIKAELHCHIEGATPPALAARLAAKYGIDLSRYLADGRYLWHDFSSFIACYAAIANVFRSEEDFAALAEAYLIELAAENTIYAELFVSPEQGLAAGLSKDGYMRAITAGIEAARDKTGIEARMVMIGERHMGPEQVEGAARYAVSCDFPLLTGFNMAGDERMGRVDDFGRAFDIARDGGLGITIHAGEVCGAFSVRDALDRVRPDRIGHGVRAVEEPDLVRRLADEGVVLEVCPGSNIALSVYPDFAAHPLRRLFDAGVKVTLNSDDPPFFHTSLAREYEAARDEMGFSTDEIDMMTRTAIEAAFVDEPTRERLLSRFAG